MATAAQMQVSDEIAIQITAMNKWYGTFHVLRDINMTVARGERIARIYDRYFDQLYGNGRRMGIDFVGEEGLAPGDRAGG